LSTSSFFCASPCTFTLAASPLPASPRMLPSAPLPTAVAIVLQARATTSISRRRSALMWPACCSSIRNRVREMGFAGFIGGSAERGPAIVKGRATITDISAARHRSGKQPSADDAPEHTMGEIENLLPALLTALGLGL